ncbi:PBP1A family penicillin-binding protein [Candidatus Wolfebacteria bacterium]|nr:PBP1A family penicillin-binding protein [Candidatus Wolfebacteria bacterium]
MAKNKKISFWAKLSVSALVFLIGLGVFAFYNLANLAKNLPDPQQSISWQMSQSTKIYDRTGQVLLYEMNNQGKRTVISLDQIPEYVKTATIAVEDKDFYTHSALDWRGIARSIIKNLIRGGFAQGGSTITQQLARNAFLTPEKTVSRKLKEVILSYWIEKYYSKDKILELYLNQIGYGAGSYGIEAASQVYFGKSAKDLTLLEAATLAAMPQSPSYYSPWGPHLDELLKRKDYALEQMRNLGFIDAEERDRNAKEKPLFVEKNMGNIKAPHFVMMVKDYLINKYGEDLVNKGGLKVITTLDLNLQKIAETAVTNGAKRNSELYKGNNAALVAQDPKTGQILALVGSADYFDTANEGNFNVAAQGLRQPGSAIKPLIYVTAFKKGYSPDTAVFDTPTEFSTDSQKCPLINIDYSKDTKEECYHPQNFDHQFRGPVNLRNALAQSINIPAVKMLYLSGLNDVLQTAQDFGITTLVDPSRYGLSLTLGGGEIKLIDLVEAYSVFAQEGVKHQQNFILEVSDYNNNVLEKYLDRATQVIEPQYTRLINDILSDAEARKPLYQGSFNLTVFDNRDVALKTGTTNDYKDAWTIGYSPYLIAGVWAGNNHQESMQKNAGSILAALPIWNEFMSQALNNLPNESFNKPDPVLETKPMLNGEYLINNQVHDILYFIDKNNPLGAVPQNPQNDPQFNNWDFPVQVWAQQNLPFISQTIANTQLIN